MQLSSGDATYIARHLLWSLITAPILSLLTRKSCLQGRPGGLNGCHAFGFQFTWEYWHDRINVAEPLSRHPSFEFASTLASITSGISRLALPDNAVLSGVATAALAAPAAPVADSSAPAPAAVDTENAAAAAADQDMLSMIIQGYSDDPWFATASHTDSLDEFQGLYYRGDALVVPDIPNLKKSILQGLHGANYSGHVGYRRTIHSVNRMYWWPGMATQIREYVKGCKTCQEGKSLQTHPSGKLVPIPIPKQPWHHVTVDRIISLPKKGHTAILAVVDKLTKMTHFAACKNESTAADMATLFYQMIWKLHGMPLRITSDRGLSLSTSLLLLFVKLWAPCTANPQPITLRQTFKLSG